LDGVYALAMKDADTVVLARDRVGVRQLYYYTLGPLVAFASERKSLVALGGDAVEIHRLPPGHMLVIKPGGCRLRRYWHPESLKSDWLIEERHEALRRYDQALTESIRKRVHDRDRVGIIYSGGVDSFLIAHLVKELGVPFTCYTAGRDQGASDIEWARSTAKDHGFPLKVRSLSVEDIQGMIPEVIATIEDHSLNQVEVAVPIFASIRMAQEAGERVILTGQGADELFGGYPWYPAVVDQEGYDAFVDRSWDDTFLLYKECLEREDKIAMAHSLELRVPYLDPEVIRVAFEISPELKIARNGDNVQKRIHRAYCLALDLPTDIAMRSKEAAQHGANVHDVFEQLAEQKGYSAGLLDRVEYDPARSVTEKLGSSSRYGYRYGREDLWKPLPHVQFYLDTLAAEQGVLPRASRFHFETTQMKLASLEVH
jgi:asparagine synthase (glutamine-hydrolysing)